MLSEKHQKAAAREILAIAGVLLLAIALTVCSGPIEYPFPWIVTGLYLTRWVGWALAKGDRGMFRQNGLILAFVGGVALVVGSAIDLAALAVMLQRESQPGLVATVLASVPAIVRAALGMLLARWSLSRQRKGMQPES